MIARLAGCGASAPADGADNSQTADSSGAEETADAAGTGPTMILASSAYRFTYGDDMQNVADIFDKTSLDKSDFMQSYRDYCTDGDYEYFVPFQVVGYYMYWNKDLFEAAGLDPEKAPATWDEWKVSSSARSVRERNLKNFFCLFIFRWSAWETRCLSRSRRPA